MGGTTGLIRWMVDLLSACFMKPREQNSRKLFGGKTMGVPLISLRYHILSYYLCIIKALSMFTWDRLKHSIHSLEVPKKRRSPGPVKRKIKNRRHLVTQ